MAILTVEPQPMQNKYTIDAAGRRTARQDYFVTTDTNMGYYKDIYADVRVPKWNSPLTGDLSLRVSGIDIAPISGDMRRFKVTITYDQNLNVRENPWEGNPKITFSPEYTQEAAAKAYDLSKDKNGEPSVLIQNSAKDPFEDPVKRQVARVIIRVSLDVDKFSPTTIANYINTTNNDPVTIAGIIGYAKDFRLRDYRAVKNYTPDAVEYYSLSYEFVYDPSSHVTDVLDQGYSALFDGKKRQIMQSDISSDAVATGAANDFPVKKPVKLDGTGKLLASGADPAYISYDVLYSTNWSALPRFADFGNFYTTSSNPVVIT